MSRSACFAALRLPQCYDVAIVFPICLWEAAAAAHFERLLTGVSMIKFKAVLASISLLAGVVQFSPSAWATDYLYSYTGSYGEFTYVSQGGFVDSTEHPLEDLQSHSFVPDLGIVSVVFEPNGIDNDQIVFLSIPCEQDTCDISYFSIGALSAVGNYTGQDENNAPSTLSVSVFTPGAVPEVSTWAMMLLGFGGIGLAGYLRPRKSPTFG
jgi:hypothetical protein